MDNEKNEHKRGSAKKVFDVTTTIAAAIAAGFGACWGAQAHLPYGDLVNSLLPAISAIVASFVGSFAIGMVMALVLGTARSIQGTTNFETDEEDSEPIASRLTPGQIVISGIICPLFAGMGSIYAAGAAGDATGFVRGLWIVGGSIVGWYVAKAAAVLVITAVLLLIAALFGRKSGSSEPLDDDENPRYPSQSGGSVSPESLRAGDAGTVDAKTSIAVAMTRAGMNIRALDGSDDFGYVEKWDNKHITVAWHNYYELEVGGMLERLYPGAQWGPGYYGVSSAGQDGIVKPEQLVDIRYIIFPDGRYDSRAVPADAVKGLADTLEHAEMLVKWSEDHGQKMRYAEIH
jgi:hypothetical protein